MRTPLAVVAVLLVLVVAPGAGAAAPSSAGGPVAADSGTGTYADYPSVPGGGTDGHDACAPVADGPQRADPDDDTLGWEAGCWYDDPVAVTVEDGLNETELDAVVARTMARIERVRGLEFRESVPVEVIPRETYVERNRARFDNASTAARLHTDVVHEALFFVGEDADALREVESNRGTSVQGYYSPSADRIVVVSDGGTDGGLALDERTLAHELAHALQDQHFDIGRYDRSTTERRNAINGLVEGDAHYVEQLYLERCEGAWNCSTAADDGPAEVPPDFHWGIYLLNFQPYSDGPAFVERLRERGGWEAVDAAYDAPPDASEQVIHPEKYPEERPTNVTVADRSDDRWRPLTVDPGSVHSGVDHAELGQAGVSTMFVYPTYDDDGEAAFVTRREFSNAGSERDPLNYGNQYSDGWAGDRLVPYVTNDSAATGETGYVWKLAWDSEADAVEFTTAYTRLLELRDAEPVDGRTGTYRIPDDRRFGDAYYLNRTEDTVVVVNAPTVDDLPSVRAGAAPPAPDDSNGSPASGSPGSGVVSPADHGTATGPFSTTSAGVGVVAALAALVAAALALRLR